MNDIEQWLNNIRKNKSHYVKALKNMNNDQVLKLRREAAEAGFEMTPSEVYSYLNMLRDIVLDK